MGFWLELFQLHSQFLISTFKPRLTRSQRSPDSRFLLLQIRVLDDASGLHNECARQSSEHKHVYKEHHHEACQVPEMDGEIELELGLLLHSQSEHNQKEGQIEVNRARLGERSVDEKGGVSTEQEKRRVN